MSSESLKSVVYSNDRVLTLILCLFNEPAERSYAYGN